MNSNENSKQPLSRRDALKMLAAAGGATALATVPHRWQTPVVEGGALPAFAQGSAIVVSSENYPFENEPPEMEGDLDGLQTATDLNGWIAIGEEGQNVNASQAWLTGRPWLRINRRWNVLTAPWTKKRKFKIKYDFKAKRSRGYGSSHKLRDNVDLWFNIASGATAYFGQYYAHKVKIKKNKIEIEFHLPEIGSGFFPFYCSGYFPFNIRLAGGFLYSPGYYLGPGIVGDRVNLAATPVPTPTPTSTSTPTPTSTPSTRSNTTDSEFEPVENPN